MNRRTFVQTIGALAPVSAFANELQAQQQQQGKSVVISTWAGNTKANEQAWKQLLLNNNALDAVHQGVMVPEADPEDMSVGYGGLPDRDGIVTLDACIMDHLGNIGAVMAIEHIIHASSVARLVMEKTPHVQIVGDGALQFALENGFKKENLLTEKSRKAWQEWLKTSKYNPMTTMDEIQKSIEKNHDTIGMLAINSTQNISGACSTSGMAYKLHGRVGDSPIIGAGLYVDNEIGAATATGVGEEVVRICGSHTVVEAMRYGKSPEEACRIAIERLVKIKGEAYCKKVQIGFIALNKKGDIGCYSLVPNFTMAVRDENGSRVVQSKSIF
ncbi:MAG: N(4)-(beta-N-acetylglucosaminyl)-L-asparaginase [Bacteroidetes bacterium]|nr:N(4)-(beta-N-acetylglucosaminyl)-L-asparaginase [Bacteroidota bacterium]MBK9301104.1 N(4)-(beta-N-acetylglucosaminyl)-L-asparaginase [Bacteroidota bacterium]HQW46328.1 N(4)-(beta-N-acetylglucosaminyl)-L-asparaginase [Chitinophagaceae bacterium]